MNQSSSGLAHFLSFKLLGNFHSNLFRSHTQFALHQLQAGVIVQQETLHTFYVDGDAISHLREHAIALGVVVIQVHVNGFPGVPVAEKQVMVVVDLDSTPKFSLGVVVTDHDVALRTDEHTHAIRHAVASDFTLVKHP